MGPVPYCYVGHTFVVFCHLWESLGHFFLIDCHVFAVWEVLQRLPCKPLNSMFMLLRLWPRVFWRAWFDWHVPMRGSYSTVRRHWLDWTRFSIFSPRVVERGVNISSWKRGEHGKRKCVQNQHPAISMVLVQTGSQIHMDFDVQSSKAQSAKIPTLATRMYGNRTWDWMDGKQHRFLLLSLSDGQIRSNAKMPLRWSFCTRPISTGLRMTEIS